MLLFFFKFENQCFNIYGLEIQSGIKENTWKCILFGGIMLVQAYVNFACCQCRIKVGAIDAAALGPFVKQAPYGYRSDDKFFCEFSWLHTLRRHGDASQRGSKAPKSTSTAVGALPRTPLGRLQHPRLSAILSTSYTAQT